MINYILLSSPFFFLITLIQDIFVSSSSDLFFLLTNWISYPKTKMSSFNLTLYRFSASSMAISLPTSYSSRHFPTKSSNSVSSSCLLSSFSSLRLPSQIRRFGIRHERLNSPSSTRYAPLTVSSPFNFTATVIVLNS